MSTTNSNSDQKSDVHLPGKRLGVIARVTSRDRGFVFIRDEAGEEYFAHRGGFLSQAVFDAIEQGQAVTFRGVRKTKGLQAHTVDLAGEADQATVALWSEGIGNR